MSAHKNDSGPTKYQVQSVEEGSMQSSFLGCSGVRELMRNLREKFLQSVFDYYYDRENWFMVDSFPKTNTSHIFILYEPKKRPSLYEIYSSGAGSVFVDHLFKKHLPTTDPAEEIRNRVKSDLYLSAYMEGVLNTINNASRNMKRALDEVLGKIIEIIGETLPDYDVTFSLVRKNVDYRYEVEIKNFPMENVINLLKPAYASSGPEKDFVPLSKIITRYIQEKYRETVDLLCSMDVKATKSTMGYYFSKKVLYWVLFGTEDLLKEMQDYAKQRKGEFTASVRKVPVLALYIPQLNRRVAWSQGSSLKSYSKM